MQTSNLTRIAMQIKVFDSSTPPIISITRQLRAAKGSWIQGIQIYKGGQEPCTHIVACPDIYIERYI